MKLLRFREFLKVNCVISLLFNFGSTNLLLGIFDIQDGLRKVLRDALWGTIYYQAGEENCRYTMEHTDS